MKFYLRIEKNVELYNCKMLLKIEIKNKIIWGSINP